MMEFLSAIPVQQLFTLVALFFVTESTVQIMKALQFWPFNLINTRDRIKFVVFVVAWMFCGAADYGLLTSLIQLGENAKPFLRFFDYVGTAAVVARFSGLTYKSIEALLAKADAKKLLATSGTPDKTAAAA